MRIAFFGTGEFSKNILEDLLKDYRVEVELVVSQPDKPVWRKKILEKTAVKILAEQNNIEVLQPEKLWKNNEFLDYLDSLELDFILVVAYWKIVPERVLKSAKYWAINLHWSILPKYRWASPIQEAIKNWDTKTGLTVMYMSKWMDEWDILEIKEVEIEENDKTKDIFRKFEEFWAELAVDVMEKIVEWKINPIQQNNDKASYCSKISKEDWEIDFKEQDWEEIYNKFRAYNPWPGIFTFYKWKKFNIEDCELKTSPLAPLLKGEGEIPLWKVLKLSKKEIWIVCKNKKILLLKQVKLEWKKSMDIISFINWNKDFLDYKF